MGHFLKILTLLLVVWPAALMAQTAQSPAPRQDAFPSNYAAPTGSSSMSTTTPAASKQDFIPLAPRGRSNRTDATKPSGGLGSLATMAGSLAIVLGLFLAIVWLMRRAAPKGSQPLPKEVVEVLGRAPLAGRQQVHLLRCGNKLLLVAVNPSGTETLAEVTDPAEVERLTALCRPSRPRAAAGKPQPPAGKPTGAERGGPEDDDA